MNMAGTPLDLLRENAANVAARLRVLAHPDRLVMLCRMTAGEASVGELVELTGLAQSSVSQHLALLRDAGAVKVRAEAQTRYYRVVDDQISAMISALCSVCVPQAEGQA
jgi:DNA-binding transcriptional ArsR family regulator